MSTPVITVILNPSGSLRFASEKISVADAERWAAEGKTVFRVAAAGERWAVNHVNSGKVIDDRATVVATVRDGPGLAAEVALLPSPSGDHT